jgi:hypothetical protein
MEIIIGCIMFVLAVYIGAWRQMCSVYAVSLPYNCPSAWRNTMVRVGTWVLVAIFALAGSFIFSTWIVNNIGDFIGRFSFGVFLAIRWTLSLVLGAIPAHKKSSGE